MNSEEPSNGDVSQSRQKRRRCAVNCCKHMSYRQIFVAIGTIILGVFKGIVMLPFVLITHLLLCILVNIMALITVFDYSYAGTRFSKRLGPNIKFIIYLVLPLFVLLLFVITPVLAVLAAIGLSLIYPAYVTLDSQRQSAFRFVLLTSGWYEMVRMTGKNIEAYLNFFYAYIPDRAKAEIKHPHVGEPFDIHPFNFVLAICIFLFGGIAFGLCSVFMLVIKILPMMGRAYLNHVRGAGQWFRGGRITMILAFVGVIIGIPIFAALTFPVALLYAFVVSFRAGRATMDARGALQAPFMVLKDAFMEIHRGTSKYIFNQDVPFLVLPSTNPIHFPWLVAGIIPFICGIVVNCVTLALLALLSIVPCTVRSYFKIFKALSEGGKAGKKGVAVLLYFLLVILPAVVIAAIALLYVKAIFQHAGVFMVMNKSKSFAEGFRFVFGINYRFEYGFNAYVYKTNMDETVHWASFVPFLREWAHPYMDPALFEMHDNKPVSIVTQQARFRPAGLRKPKKDAEGRVIDMSRAGYHIPGVGVAPILDGQLGPVIPHGDPGSAIPSGTVLPSALYQGPLQSNLSSPVKGSTAQAEATPKSDQKAAAKAPVARPACLCCSGASYLADADDSEEVDKRFDQPPPPAGDVEAAVAGSANAADDTDSKDIVLDVPTDPVGEAQEVTAQVAPQSPGAKNTEDAKPTLEVETPVQVAVEEAQPSKKSAKGSAAMPSSPAQPAVEDKKDEDVSPTRQRAAHALFLAQQALSAAANMTALAKEAREREAAPLHLSPHDRQNSPTASGTAAVDLSPGGARAASVVAKNIEQATPAAAAVKATAGIPRPSLSKSKSSSAEANDDDDDDDDVFILMPIVRADLPDTWVPVSKDGETYYVNYARNQSNWTIPPGF